MANSSTSVKYVKQETVIADHEHSTSLVHITNDIDIRAQAFGSPEKAG